MIQLIMKPTLHKFSTCKAFAEEFSLCAEDLILTNEYIFHPLFSDLANGATILYQEKFGAGEPTDIMVDEILKVAHSSNYTRIIAIGGGTVIDIAKIIAVAAKGDDTDALYNKMNNLTKQASLIIIPTTCGTGSEMTNISIVNRTKIGTKLGLVSSAMYADDAVLIPELLKTLPYGVFATSSIDALVHCVEAYLSPKSTSYTDLFAESGIRMIIKGYQKIAADGREVLPNIIDDFLVASNYGGCAFGTAGCAAVHAMSYPLGGTYHVAHGESNYAMFTGILKKYHQMNAAGKLLALEEMLCSLLDCSASDVFDSLDALLNKILPKKALRQYGMTQEDVTIFTQSVLSGQTRLLNNNFIAFDSDCIAEIYQSLL